MVPVYLHSPSGKQLQRLEVAQGQATRRVDTIGEMTLTCIPPEVIGSDYRIVVDMDGERNTVWTVEDVEEIASGNRTLTTLYCKDGRRQYENRIVLAYDDTAYGYKINYPIQIAAEIINEQMVSPVLGGNERALYGLRTATYPEDLTNGSSAWEGEVAWKTVWDVLVEMMEYGRAVGTPFVVDLLAEATGGIDLVPFIARRHGTERRLSSTQLSRYGISVREILRTSPNKERWYVLGEGPGSLALYAQYPISLETFPQANPFYYKEGIVTLGSEDDLDALNARAQLEYTTNKSRKTLIVEGAGPARNFWGSLIGYGDLVNLSHRGSDYQMTVVGYSLEWSGAGEPTVSFALEEGY